MVIQTRTGGINGPAYQKRPAPLRGLNGDVGAAALQQQLNRFAKDAGFDPIRTDGIIGINTESALQLVALYLEGAGEDVSTTIWNWRQQYGSSNPMLLANVQGQIAADLKFCGDRLELPPAPTAATYAPSNQSGVPVKTQETGVDPRTVVSDFFGIPQAEIDAYNAANPAMAKPFPWKYVLIGAAVLVAGGTAFVIARRQKKAKFQPRFHPAHA